MTAASNQDYSPIYSYKDGPDGAAFYDRYAAFGQEKFDRIGYTPFRDNESVYNANTSWFERNQRMMTNSLIPLYTTAIVSTPRSLYKMIKGDFSPDTDYSETYGRVSAIGQDSTGGVGAFFNNAMMNSAYTAGMITEILLEEAAATLLAPITGGASLFATNANLLRRGLNTVDAIKDADKTIDGMKATTKLADELNDINKTRNFFMDTKLGRFINPLGSTLNAIRLNRTNPNNLTGLAKTYASFMNTAGGLYRDARAFNMALSEGRLEAGFTQNQIYNELYNDYYETNGTLPDNAMQGEILEQAKAAGTENLIWNTLLVYGSNKIVFPNILGPKAGLRTGMLSKLQDVKAWKHGKVVFERSKDVADNIAKGEFKYVANTFKNGLKESIKYPLTKGLPALGTYFKVNVTEGLQENAQEILARTMEKYYVDAFKADNRIAFDFNRGSSRYESDQLGLSLLTGSGQDYFKKELKAEFSAQGFETFATGFIMGGFMKVLNALPKYMEIGYNKMFNKEEYQKTKDEIANYGKRVSDALNVLYNSPEEFYNSRYFNYANQQVLSKIKKRGGSKDSKDATSDAFISHIYTALDSNTFDMFIDHINSFKQMTPEEFEEAFGFEKGVGQKYQGRIDSMVEKAYKMQTRYNNLEKNFPSPVNLSELKKGTVEYENASLLSKAWNLSKMNALFLGETFDNVSERMVSIVDTLTSKGPLEGMNSADIGVLFNNDRILQEIEMLKSELALETDETVPEIRRDDVYKKRKLEALEAFYNARQEHFKYYSRNNNLDEKIDAMVQIKGAELTQEEIDAVLDLQHGKESEENERKINDELKRTYKDYIKTLSSKDNQILFDTAVEDSYEKLSDYYKLDNESRRLAEYINVLSSPEGYLRNVEKNNQWMTRLYKNRKSYYKELVAKAQDNVVRNSLLNVLANDNVFIDPEQLEGWLEDGVPPKEFFDNTKKMVIPLGSLRYDKYFNQLVRAKQLTDEINKNTTEDVEQTLDSELQEELDRINQEEQEAIDKLETKTVEVEVETIKPKSPRKIITLKDIDDGTNVGEKVKALPAKGKGVVEFIKDENGILKTLDGQKATTKQKFKEAKTFRFEQAPIDEAQLQSIRDDFEQQRKDAITRFNERNEVVEETETEETEVTLIPANVSPQDLRTMDANFAMKLQQDFMATMSEDQMIEYTNLDGAAQDTRFDDYLRGKDAQEKIAEYNRAKSTKSKVDEQIGETEEFEVVVDNVKRDTTKLNVNQLKKLERDLVQEISKLSNLTNKTSETESKILQNRASIQKIKGLIRKRLKAGMSPEMQKTIATLENFISENKNIRQEEGSYKEGDQTFERVSNVTGEAIGSEFNHPKLEEIVDSYTRIVGDEVTEEKVTEFIEDLKTKNYDGITDTTYEKIKETTDVESLKEAINNNAYIAGREAGNYLDEQFKMLMAGKEPVYNSDKISREAFDNLFQKEDKAEKKKAGYFRDLKNRMDAGEFYIFTEDLVVRDTGLGEANRAVAGEIDALVVDTNGNVFIVDLKTSKKKSWNNYNNINKSKALEIAPSDKKIMNTAQQRAYSNLLYNMLGIDAGIGILPVQIEYDANNEAGYITEAGKPESATLFGKETASLPADQRPFTIKLDPSLNVKTKGKTVQELVDEVIPRKGKTETKTESKGKPLNKTQRIFNNLLNKINNDVNTLEDYEGMKGFIQQAAIKFGLSVDQLQEAVDTLEKVKKDNNDFKGVKIPTGLKLNVGQKLIAMTNINNDVLQDDVVLVKGIDGKSITLVKAESGAVPFVLSSDLISKNFSNYQATENSTGEADTKINPDVNESLKESKTNAQGVLNQDNKDDINKGAKSSGEELDNILDNICL